MRDDLRHYVTGRFGDSDAVLVVDETGDVKKGQHTVGVQRQYTGTAGRIDHAQDADYLVYAGTRGHAMIDRELYLPRCWPEGPPGRCAHYVEFATKPALPIGMITRALRAGAPARWVAGDEVYGADPALRRVRTRPDRLRAGHRLAFVRAMHLALFREYGDTFELRVVTMRHAGMPKAVMHNIERSYRSLRLPDDPGCELLLVDGDTVSQFHVDTPLPPEVISQNSLDSLMNGRRTYADGRPTFCNACNLSVANSFGVAASHRGGVDVIITGDSPNEQRSYAMWIHRLARRFGLQPNREKDRAGFRGVLTTLDNIGQAYFREVHGPYSSTEERRIATGVPERLVFFSIYDDTGYASGDHWELLTEYLGFEFDEVAFNFTESDCGNPALMAHLRGLKSERMYGRSYQEGLTEYVDFALSLMRKKEFPDHLINMMARRYHGEEAVINMRRAATEYARSVFGLTPEQLVCMVYSPFAGEGAGLRGYLDREQPHLADRETALRAVLDQHEDPSLRDELERMSGLSLENLRDLYRGPIWSSSPTTKERGLLPAILDGDPHQQAVHTRQDTNGPLVEERISGR